MRARQAMHRRRFIGTAAAAGLTLLTGAAAKRPEPRLVILHTNDTHSRIDPFPMDGGSLQGLAGVSRRKTLIDRIRRENEHVLTLDSGDVFQGTPYYNLYGGEVEIEAMNRMGYQACAVGNHEFDNGMAALAKAMRQSRFKWICSNLHVAGSSLAGLVQPWSVMEVGPFRVGLLGLICRLQGMVSPVNHDGAVYLDPVESSRRAVRALRAEGCNLIVCLSHIGYKRGRDQEELRDVDLPALVEGIDLILGGHSHTFIDELDTAPRRGGGVTRITQQGWAGIRLGRIEVGLPRGGRPLAMAQRPMTVA